MIATDWEVSDWRTCGQLVKGYPGYRFQVADDFDKKVPICEVGELVIWFNTSWALSTGYLGRPEESAPAWRNGWFHTGDAFKVDHTGNYFFVDRIKDCIRRGSENISSVEIQTEVLGRPDVAGCDGPSCSHGYRQGRGEDRRKFQSNHVEPEEPSEFLTLQIPGQMPPRFIEIGPSAFAEKVQQHVLRENYINPETRDRLEAQSEEVSR